MNFRFVVPILFTLLISADAGAHDYKLGALEIAHPWSRATPKGAAIGGGYLKITNTGSTPDRLIGGSTEVAKGFQIHEMRMDRGVMTMREVTGGLTVAPGTTVELKPGSFHLMFVDLSRPLVKGERIKGTLVFEKAGRLDVEFEVEAIGASPKPDEAPAHHH